MKQRVIVLGSTGSVGRNTLSVLDGLADGWSVVGLAAGSNWEMLADQVEGFHPEAVAIRDGECGGAAGRRIASKAKLLQGPDSLTALVDSVDCDCVVTAIVGTDGIHATLRAAELGRRIALANKESLVVAGGLLMATAAEHGATIIPVDSEHSAIFQALHAGRSDEVAGVYLTASGGPFRTLDAEAMEGVTLEDALKHPTWDMGPKITIDSATMMNKALEIVEARWLFDLRAEQIHVVIHPESIIHSWVEFRDGSMIAQLGAPDMKTPIQYALTYPRRMPGRSTRLDWTRALQLNLEPPDVVRFPAIRLGLEAARRGGTAGAVLNAANEAAVALFRDGLITYPDIVRLVENALSQHDWIESPELGALFDADRRARQEVARCTTC
ncbi:MAG: 1-deoxy-D-xylulose-5-phosphate reductoisomerase [Phycisphaerae bacterium]